MAGRPDPEGIDLDAIRRVVETADVFVIRFSMIEQRLLVDARPDSDGLPYIRLVPPVTSAEERYRFLQKERPGMPLPDQITVFHWPRSIRALREAGVWADIERRMMSVGGEPAVDRAALAFREGLRLERADVVAMIRGGEGYQTLWTRTESS
ncbi:MAG: hypothetical protein CVU47_12270 [Chloroflexi bacterium HGW-Chloroflexi-9]|nr:MAG: hypothetical protein CVU47_12270 [Chloroflexi bacterium HGW-Chloroflexi-9]